MEVQQLYAAVKKTGVVRSLMGGPAESQRAVPLPTPSPATQAATSGMEVKKKQGWQEVGGGGCVLRHGHHHGEALSEEGGRDRSGSLHGKAREIINGV